MKTKRSDKRITKFTILRHSLQYALKNKDWLKANKLRAAVAELLTRSNIELGKLCYSDAAYEPGVTAYNAAAIEAEKAKFYWERAMDSGDRADWQQAFAHFARAMAIARHLFSSMTGKSTNRMTIEKLATASNGTEIPFAGDVPLVPEILPVIILRGSDFDMGYQYAQQVIQIFGPWIMERKAKKRFSSTEMECMRRWEEQIRQYAPEILEMCRGWAAGATDAGVPMRYENVLDLWTGHTPPASRPYNLSMIGLPAELARPFCSGAAAWGRATVDGRLVTASTGDHNPSHAATIVAFPATGHSFIVTPFHVTGDIRSAPHMFMMGHPGMNSAGLAYVEHGGEPRLAEPMDRWGYGIRKGTAIFHILRFAGSAKEALQMELSFPVGDVGTVMGSVGGFWADSSYAFVPERRTEPIAVREAGMLGETDFMYACNGILHPDLKDVWWMRPDADNWAWDEHGGWVPKQYKNFKRGMMGDPWKMLSVSASMIQRGNRDRCLFFYRMMNGALGSIDLAYMKAVLRRGGILPQSPWRSAVAHFEKSGDWGEVSAAHSTNTITVAMRPGKNGDGVYCLCHGEAKRGLVPFSPKQGVYMVNETNAFWEIRLAPTPEEVALHAREKAYETIGAAQNVLPAVLPAFLQGLYDDSTREFTAGMAEESLAKTGAGNAALYAWAKAVRHFTKAQVRSLQVVQALELSPSSNISSTPAP